MNKQELSKDKVDQLKAAAEQLAAGVPEKQRTQFKADYLQVMTDLNEVLDARLAAMEDRILPVLTAYVPSNPSTVMTHAANFRGMVHNLVGSFMTTFAAVPLPSVRAIMLDTVGSLLVDTYDATHRSMELTEKRMGQKTI